MIDQLESGALVALLDRLREAVWFRTPAGHPLFVNAAFEDLLGVRRAEYREDPWAFLRHVVPEHHERVIGAWKAAREGRVELRLQVRPPGEEARWLRARVSPLHNGGGELVAILGVAEDVTSEVRAREWRELEREASEAATRERQRVGAELHDSVGQKLTGAALLARSLESRLAAGQPVQAEDLGMVSDVLDGLISEIRRISRGLFPAELKEESLGAALTGLAAEVEELFDVRCTVRESSGTTFPMETKLHLFRIAQELMTNAIKHGGAERLWVELYRTAVGVELSVEHDGRERDSANADEAGVGLRSLAYRARSIRASLHRGDTSEGRTRITCRIPV